MSKLVSDIYFYSLKEKEPLDVCRRLNCEYEPTKECYIISVWNDNYAIFLKEKKIKRISNNLPEHDPLLYVFIMYFLTTIKSGQLTNEWISEKDLFSGSTFFRGPHEIPTYLISNKFSNNLEKFKSKCEQLMGTPIDMGDLGYVFKITDNITVALLYWIGDNTFGPEAKLLFDKSIHELLPLDIIFCLAKDICIRFVK